MIRMVDKDGDGQARKLRRFLSLILRALTGYPSMVHVTPLYFILYINRAASQIFTRWLLVGNCPRRD